jgi:protein ImuB
MAADAAARRAGLRVGMPATKVQALVTGLVIRDADPAADAAALERLALWALQHYAPIAAVDPPDGLVIDVTGAAHLHGGEDVMLAVMIERLGAAGIVAHAAIADHWGTAHALARYAARPSVTVPPGEGAAAITPLPIAALRFISLARAGSPSRRSSTSRTHREQSLQTNCKPSSCRRQ